MKPLILLMTAGLLSAEAPKSEADPVSDRLRFEVALAQRDYLMAKAELDKASQKLQEKYQVAIKACQSAGKEWKTEAFTCLDADKP